MSTNPPPSESFYSGRAQIYDRELGLYVYRKNLNQGASEGEYRSPVNNETEYSDAAYAY